MISERVLGTISDRVLAMMSERVLGTISDRVLAMLSERVLGTIISKRVLAMISERVLGTISDRVLAMLSERVLRTIISKRVRASVSGPLDESRKQGPGCCWPAQVKEPTAVWKVLPRQQSVDIALTLRLDSNWVAQLCCCRLTSGKAPRTFFSFF